MSEELSNVKPSLDLDQSLPLAVWSVGRLAGSMVSMLESMSDVGLAGWLHHHGEHCQGVRTHCPA